MGRILDLRTFVVTAPMPRETAGPRQYALRRDPANPVSIRRTFVCGTDRSRKLDTRAGFFSPSLDGGLPLFELFNPSRRSSSAIWALSAATSAMSSSRDGSASDSAFIESLNRSQIPLSRKFCTVVCGKQCSLT